jgi:hypothetical protein
MIYTEGFTALSDLTDATLNEMLDMHLVQGDFIGPKLPYEVSDFNAWAEHAAASEGYQSLWNFLRSLPNAWTLTPNLGAVMLSVRAFTVSSHEFSMGVYVDLERGTLGSGYGVENAGDEIPEQSMSEAEARKSFGPYAYCPILVSRTDAECYLAEISRWEGRQTKELSPKNDSIRASDALDSSQINNRRGAPKKGGGVIEHAVRTEFMDRFRSGQLTAKDATVWEAIVWAERLLGERVSRSTMQRYLRPIFDAMNAHNPQPSWAQKP